MNNLKGVKVGVLLVASGLGLGRDERRVVKIERMTKKFIVVTGGFRYNRETGKLAGRTEYSCARIDVVNDAGLVAVTQEQRLRVRRNRLRITNWKDIGEDKIRQIWEILNA